jgi:hypothetical protein
LDYRDESYVEQVCKQDASEAEAPVDEAATTATDEAAEEAGQDEAYDYYTEYGDYGYDYEEYEYHYGEAYDDDPSQTVDWDDAVESSMSDETVSEEPACDETVTEAPTCEEPAETARENAWEDEHYWGYEHYDYGYDTKAYECECEKQEKYDANEVASGIEETAGGSDAPAVNEAQAAVSPQKLQREAVLSLARTLNRIGTSLQKISQTLTDMAAQEVAVQTTGDTVER